MSIVYIVCARFDQLSFERQKKYVRPVAERMKSFTESLEAEVVMLIAELEKGRSRRAVALTSTAKVCCFAVAVAAIIPGCSIVLFFSIMRKVFLNLLIGWRGLNLGSMVAMFARFVRVVEQLTGRLGVSVPLLRILLYPLEWMCQLVDFFNVDGVYSLVTVTCEGAKAPIELFIDSSVLGAAILFIKSNYIFLWAITFHEMNKLSLVKFWMGRKSMLSVNLAVMGLLFLLSSANPFITMLRFFLSFVNFGAFFEYNHVTHVLSKACIGISGFQNQELLLVYSTSLLVWWLIVPMLYSTADILCPRGGHAVAGNGDPRTKAAAAVAPVKWEHSDGGGSAGGSAGGLSDNDSGSSSSSDSSIGRSGSIESLYTESSLSLSSTSSIIDVSECSSSESLSGDIQIDFKDSEGDSNSAAGAANGRTACGNRTVFRSGDCNDSPIDYSVVLSEESDSLCGDDFEVSEYDGSDAVVPMSDHGAGALGDAAEGLAATSLPPFQDTIIAAIQAAVQATDRSALAATSLPPFQDTIIAAIQAAVQATNRSTDLPSV